MSTTIRNLSPVTPLDQNYGPTRSDNLCSIALRSTPSPKTTVAFTPVDGSDFRRSSPDNLYSIAFRSTPSPKTTAAFTPADGSDFRRSSSEYNLYEVASRVSTASPKTRYQDVAVKIEAVFLSFKPLGDTNDSFC